MNTDIKRLLTECVGLTRDTPAAALLVLADVLSRPASGPVAEPPGSDSLTVQQTAARLSVSTKTVYQMALDGRLRSFPFCQTLNCGDKA
jgi:DNA-binding PucR family transcriptional regulator